MKRLPIIQVEHESSTSTYVFEIVRKRFVGGKTFLEREYLKELMGRRQPELPNGYYRISKARGGRFGFFKSTDFFGDEVFQLYDHQLERVVERPAGGSWCGFTVRRYGLTRARFNLIPAKTPKGVS